MYRQQSRNNTYKKNNSAQFYKINDERLYSVEIFIYIDGCRALKCTKKYILHDFIRRLTMKKNYVLKNIYIEISRALMCTKK